MLAFLIASCVTQATKTSYQQNPLEKANCKLPRVVEGSIALGFPKVEDLAPSIGVLNMMVLFVDFDDVPATKLVDSIFAIINPIVPNFFEEISYGRMELNLNPHMEWLRLSKPSAHYGAGIYKGQSHLDFIQEAVDLANDKVDFSETHTVLVISNPEAKAIALGPTFKSRDPDYHIKADGASISTGITSGYDLNYWGGIWLAHEMGHTFGLPDLYHFGNEKWNKYVGTMGLMGVCDAKAPGYFAFERWVLGWIDDDQIYCHESGEVTVEIEAIEKTGGTKAVVVSIDSTTALVVESRRKLGFDKHMPKEGALVYVVNTALPGGSGPIQIKPGVDNGKMMEDAPMLEGDIYSYENVLISVLKSNADSDIVHIKVN